MNGDIPRWMWEAADDYPFIFPPPGVVSNFQHPRLAHYHAITIACGISMFLLLVFSAIRLYTKLRLIRIRTVDDYIYCVALPTLLFLEGLYVYHYIHSADGHSDSHLPHQSNAFVSDHGRLRARQIAQTTRWGGIIGTSAFYSASFVVQAVSCRPRGGTDRIAFLAGVASEPCTGSGKPVQNMSLVSGVFGIVSNLYMLVVPLPAIAKLKISRRRKLGVYLIFASAALACITSILSLVVRVSTWGTKDITVDSIWIMTALVIELTVGLVVTCVASVAKFARCFFTTPLALSFRGGVAGDGVADPEMQPPPRRRHAPGGLSELDSMRIFDTVTEAEGAPDYSLIKALSMQTDSSASRSPILERCSSGHESVMISD